LVTDCFGTALYGRLLKESWKRRKYEEEDVSRYWMALRKRAFPGIWKRTLLIVLS
jgi:hypothetical protein